MAFVALVAATGFAVATRERNGATHVVALGAGVVAATALTISSLILIQDWPERMANFDFTALSQTERGRHQGLFFAIIFLPYEMAGIGAFAAIAFVRLLYNRVCDARR